MGEDPETVHAVGAPGTDWWWKTPEDAGLPEEFASLDTRDGLTILMLQPETLPDGLAGEDERAYRQAVEYVGWQAGALAVLRPVTDPGFEKVNSALACLEGRANTVFVYGLPPEAWWKAVRRATLIVGNSSSIVLEAGPLGVPVRLVGERQKGRLPPDRELLDGKAGARAAEVISRWSPPKPARKPLFPLPVSAPRIA